MAFPTPEELSTILQPIADRLHLDVEAVKVNKAGKKSSVTVMLDGDTRPDLDTLEVASQEISELFDAAETEGQLNFGAGYTLEVTTPGVDRPLQLPRHWRRNRGRLVAITVDGKKEIWRIGALNEQENEVVVVRKVGKNLEIDTIALAKHPEAVVEIEFAQAPEEQMALVRYSYDEAIQWREDTK
ncbi:ribosome maturation factor RimP [Corynebacterium pseudopelargi]|uniref:Ribosome maturation factor RimP n=1 Tax=Corynebacterium pseudopelargi TaxID=2080757 RepID=A0A3G6ITW6_9CORY|nr:ribosome maturation factor RimP [Corynebacterium pseudopelargi]AZA09063.1 Ribosome maturation factor RimP [Corynebacterium pseudopelargi]